MDDRNKAKMSRETLSIKDTSGLSSANSMLGAK
jgi:hypothetical protein